MFISILSAYKWAYEQAIRLILPWEVADGAFEVALESFAREPWDARELLCAFSKHGLQS